MAPIVKVAEPPAPTTPWLSDKELAKDADLIVMDEPDDVKVWSAIGRTTVKVAPTAPATVMDEAAPPLVAIKVTLVGVRTLVVDMARVPAVADAAKVPKLSAVAAVMAIGVTTVAAVATLVVAVESVAIAFPPASKSPAQPKMASLALILATIDLF